MRVLHRINWYSAAICTTLCCPLPGCRGWKEIKKHLFLRLLNFCLWMQIRFHQLDVLAKDLEGKSEAKGHLLRFLKSFLLPCKVLKDQYPGSSLSISTDTALVMARNSVSIVGTIVAQDFSNSWIRDKVLCFWIPDPAVVLQLPDYSRCCSIPRRSVWNTLASFYKTQPKDHSFSPIII